MWKIPYLGTPDPSLGSLKPYSIPCDNLIFAISVLRAMTIFKSNIEIEIEDAIYTDVELYFTSASQTPLTVGDNPIRSTDTEIIIVSTG